MRRHIMAAVAFAAAAASTAPAFAQAGRFDAGLANVLPPATQVQFRGGGDDWRPRPGMRGPGWQRGPGWRGDRGWHRRGPGIGAGVAGLAAGAIIGGAIAAQTAPAYGYYAPPPPPNDDALGYCMQRFKSFDPASGTYLGYDGFRHPCP